MFSRMLQLSAALAVGAVCLVQSATAATIDVTPGPTYTLVAGNTYRDSPDFNADEVISNVYNFISSGLNTNTTAAVLNVDPPTQGPFGIKNLRLEWFNDGNISQGFLDVTDSLGVVINPTAILSINLVADALAYHLKVTGKALGDGGSYLLRVAVPGDQQSPVPLPPALLLFGSALVGLTVLGRRKRQGATV